MITMDKIRPVINHIRWINPSGHWITRSFLPFYGNHLEWADDIKCPDGCQLAYHPHPMVQDERNEHTYHKLCTLTVIKAGLVTRKEIL